MKKKNEKEIIEKFNNIGFKDMNIVSAKNGLKNVTIHCNKCKNNFILKNLTNWFDNSTKDPGCPICSKNSKSITKEILKEKVKYLTNR